MELTYEELKQKCIELKAKNTELYDALKEASAHLDYCGYGDRYERDCARESGLMEKIEKALEE